MNNKQLCLNVAIVLLVLLCVLNRRESLGGSPSSSGGVSGSGTTSGGTSWSGVGSSGQAGGWAGRVYGVNGMLDSANALLNPPGYRLGGPFRDCSPESCPHGSSVPEAKLTVPGRGPFPYPF